MDYPLLKQVQDDKTFLSELDGRIFSALKAYIRTLSDRDEFVFGSRLGCKSPYLTLQGAGIGAAVFDKELTRERVRQIQQVLFDDWRKVSGCSAAALFEYAARYYDLLNDTFLTKTSSLFSSKKDFNRFLAMSCDVPAENIEQIYNEKVHAATLDIFWVGRGPSPLSIDDIIGYLIKTEGVNELGARNIVYHLLTADFLSYETETGLLSPKKLIKSVAIAHACHSYPDGVTWLELQKKVNDMGYCARKVPENRLDFAVGTAVDHGWIYQSMRGVYAPISSLSQAIGEIDIQEFLNDVKDLLEHNDGDKESIPLAKLFNQNVEMFNELDYFTVRYIVKQYGILSGIHFSGLSGSDMVSLKEEVEVISKQDVILNEVKDGREFSLEEVALLLRSSSIRHAAYLVDNLVKEGKVVKLGKDAYILSGQVNGGIDIKTLMALVYKHLKRNLGEKCDYASLLTLIQDELSIKLKGIEHLASLARANHGDLKGEWTFSGNYVTLNNK